MAAAAARDRARARIDDVNHLIMLYVVVVCQLKGVKGVEASRLMKRDLDGLFGMVTARLYR